VPHAFVKPQGGALIDLTAKLAGTVPDNPFFPFYGWASDINAGGTVINSLGQIDDSNVFQYAGGKFIPGAPGSYAGKINDNGVTANIYVDPANAAVMVARGGTTFTIEPTEVGGINNLDQVVGYSWLDNRAYLYEPGGTVHTFGPTGAAPKDVNNQGIIVGRLGEDTGDHRAFVFHNGMLTDLNTLVTLPAGVVLTEAVGINDKGQIAVNGLKAGREVAFLLTPAGAGGSITGRVFNDANRNGVRNAGESGLSDWRVYVDANKNGVWNIGEQITRTNAAGDYKLTNLPAGTFRVYEVRRDGWTRTDPPGNWPMGYFDATLAGGQVVTGKDFGNVSPPSLSVASVAAAEGNAGINSLTFTVWLSAASADPVTVQFSTGDDTAKALGDYSKRSGTLIFAPGETARTVNIAVRGDTAVEADERFRFILDNPSGATIAKALAFGTIRNDDRNLAGTDKGAVSGVVFKDLNGNRVQDAGEARLSGWLVYADLNRDGRLNANEPRTVTNSKGKYVLSNVPAGQQLLRLERRTAWQQTLPRGGGAHGPTILIDTEIGHWDFGIRPILG